ncbi:hypothetical protein Scep_021999 [Stephania cephalantha]|uniref:Uncharacterized protein n=1 Tax=Stephania cephalantha TaxID=152367 RepID=A0AAP0F739_9MAGN
MCSVSIEILKGGGEEKKRIGSGGEKEERRERERSTAEEIGGASGTGDSRDRRDGGVDRRQWRMTGSSALAELQRGAGGVARGSAAAGRDAADDLEAATQARTSSGSRQRLGADGGWPQQRQRSRGWRRLRTADLAGAAVAAIPAVAATILAATTTTTVSARTATTANDGVAATR